MIKAFTLEKKDALLVEGSHKCKAWMQASNERDEAGSEPGVSRNENRQRYASIYPVRKRAKNRRCLKELPNTGHVPTKPFVAPPSCLGRRRRRPTLCSQVPTPLLLLCSFLLSRVLCHWKCFLSSSEYRTRFLLSFLRKFF